jgi:cysteine desulfurase
LADVYLDNSATTRVWPEVLEVMAAVYRDQYGNPSSLHRRGVMAEKMLDTSRQELAGVVGCHPDELYFTSGGTEANNWAVFGLAGIRRPRGRRIIATAVEHPSVLAPLDVLAERGFEVIRVPVSERGELEASQLAVALTPDTVLVTIMAVNNEVGAVQDWEILLPLVRDRSPHAAVHVDAVQALAKLPLPSPGLVDTMSFSAHKLHGPQGVGALYVRKGTRILPLLFGGEQERKMRAGTENVAGVAGFALAARLCRERGQQLAPLLRELYQGLAGIPGFGLNGPVPGEGAPHILNVYFEGIPRGEVLVHALAERGVYASTGSACHSRRSRPSHVLSAMHRSGDALTGAVRFSLGAATTREEIQQAVAATAATVAELRLHSGKGSQRGTGGHGALRRDRPQGS